MSGLFKKQALCLRLVVACAFFSTNVLFAHLPQKTFWEERQETVRKHLENFTTKPIAKLDDIFTAKSNSPINKATPFEAIGKELDNFATVRETYTGSTARVQTNPILLISDVHQHTEAQKNISNLIRQIESTTGKNKDRVGQIKNETDKVRHDSNSVSSSTFTSTCRSSVVIGMEGAWNDFNFSTFNSFPDRQILNQAADVLLDNGKLSGVSHAGVVVSSKKEKTVAFSGVDDKALYKAHMEAYKRAVLLQTPLLERLAQELAKTQNKNPSLQAFDELVNFYEKGTINLGDFITRARSEGWAQNLFAYTAISRFLKAKEIERKLDFVNVEHERNACFEALSKSLPPDKLKSLAADSVSFRMGRMSAYDYYSKLQTLVEKYTKSDLVNYKEFFRYLAYLKLAESIKPETLLLELEDLKNDIYNRLSINESERRFVRRSHFIRLARKLVNFELTPEEWEEYLKYRSYVDTTTTPDKSGNYNERYNDKIPFPFETFEKFYELATSRNKILIENLLSANSTLTSTCRLSVLIAGGFHMPGITKILRQKGIPYVLVTPKITKLDDSGSSYLTHFIRDKAPLEKLFESPKLTLAFSDMHAGTEAGQTANVRLLGIANALRGKTWKHGNGLIAFAKDRLPLGYKITAEYKAGKDTIFRGY